MPSDVSGCLSAWFRTSDPYRAGFWYGLVGPLALVVAGLTTARIAGRGLEAGLLSIPELYLSETTYLLAFGLVGHVLLDPDTGDRLRLGVLALLQIVGLTLGAVELAGYRYFAKTGAILDYPLLTRTLGNVSTNLPIALSELSTVDGALVAAIVAMLLAAPWAVCLRRAGSPETDGIATPPAGRLAAYLAGGALFAVSLSPPMLEPDTLFARSTVANVAISLGYEVRRQLTSPPSVDSPAADLAVEPTDPAGSEAPRNVAIVVLESVRASATGIYHPHLETTPFLAGLADRSTVAEHAHAPVPHTSKALVALLCGIEPRLSMWITEARPGGIPARCLPELLGDHGYRSAFFQPSHRRFERWPHLVDNLGFDHFISARHLDRERFDRVNYFGWEDDAMLPKNRAWLEARREDGEPFVATYMTLTTHHPYATPPDFEAGRFDIDPPPAAGPFRDYLRAIRYTDRFVERLVGQYRELGLAEETLFVIVSDHGEAFGEHGKRFHDNVPYQEAVRIVTMLHDPTRPDAPDIDRNVSQIDLPPTILDRLGFEITAGAFRGRTFEAIPEDRPVHLHCFYKRRCLARIAGDTKYIYRFGRRPPEVYDLADDPMERHNLADRYADRLDDWTDELLDWRRHVNAMHATK